MNNLTPKSSRVAIIGAGVIGLAIAEKLSRHGHEVYILEQNHRIADGVTSRNSGVIHSSLYYPVSSLKASLCLRGKALLYEWCSQYNIPHRKLGKLVAATAFDQFENLHQIYENAQAIGATETRLISGDEAKKIEPELNCLEALWAPDTGIVDPYAFSKSLLLQAEDRGSTLVTNCKVTAVTDAQAGFKIETSLGPIEADWVINAAGLYSDEIAKLGGFAQYQLYPWRGDYFKLKTPRHFSQLIYPVKAKGDAGLGVHLTIDLNNQYRLGPDVELAHSREDFGAREDKKEAFLLAAKKLFPWVTLDNLEYDTVGIRPKLRSPKEKEDKDFVICREETGPGRWVNLIGIESPGLTASLAIAEEVDRLMSL